MVINHSWFAFVIIFERTPIFSNLTPDSNKKLTPDSKLNVIFIMNILHRIQGIQISGRGVLNWEGWTLIRWDGNKRKHIYEIRYKILDTQGWG